MVSIVVEATIAQFTSYGDHLPESKVKNEVKILYQD